MRIELFILTVPAAFGISVLIGVLLAITAFPKDPSEQELEDEEQLEYLRMWRTKHEDH